MKSLITLLVSLLMATGPLLMSACDGAPVPHPVSPGASAATAGSVPTVVVSPTPGLRHTTAQGAAPPPKTAPAPAKTPPVKPAPAPAKPTPAPAKPTPTETAPAKTLPDGVFTGGLTSDEVTGDIQLVIRGGMVVGASVDAIRKSRYEFLLESRGAADSPGLSLTGRINTDYLSVIGEFLDGERAAGTFKGNVGRKVVSGRWYAIRR